MPGIPARYAFGSEIFPPPVVKSAVKSRPTHAVDATDKNLHNSLVLQPPLEEGRVLLLEEERQPRAARLDDAVFESGQPRL